MSLVLSDHEVFYDAASAQHPYAGSVSAIATLVPLKLKQLDGTYQVDARGGKRFPTVSLIDGSWTLTLPWPSEASPGQNPWVITRSDGTAVTGLIPEGTPGPLTVQSLVNTYGWAFVPPQTAPQVQTVTGPQGIKGDPGTAPTANANTIVAGPSSGAAAQATPRPMVLADLPVRAVQKTSVTYTLLPTDWGVIVQAAGTTQTLPDATLVVVGLPYTVTNDTGGSTTTIATQASQTINGQSAWTMQFSGSSMTVASDGTTWRIQ